MLKEINPLDGIGYKKFQCPLQPNENPDQKFKKTGRVME